MGTEDDKRHKRYAEAIGLAYNAKSRTEAVRRVIAVSDVEQAELHAEVHRYHDRAMASEAAEAGLRGDLVCHLLEIRVLQAEVAELTAKVARIEAVSNDMEQAGDVECAELLHAALAGNDQRNLPPGI